MPRWYHPNTLDNGLNVIVNNTTQVHVIKNYALADSYATVLANSVGNAALAGGDKVLGDSATGRQVTTASKSTTVTGDTLVTDDLHIALLDTVNLRVDAVTDETTDQVLTTGNPLTIPAVNWKSDQPA